MKKNCFISILAGYAVTTFPIWENRQNLWMLWILVSFLIFGVLIEIDDRGDFT